MRSMSFLRLSVVCGLAIVITGCATFSNTAPPPKLGKPMNIVFSNEGLSTMTDLTIGTYRVPESEVLITGHQKGSVAGLLFGPLGLVVTDAIDSSSAADKTKDLHAALAINISERADAQARAQISSAGLSDAFRFDGKPNPAVIKIAGGLVMTYISDTDVVPYIVLKPAIVDANNDVTWGTRYIAAVGQPRALTGDASWTEDKGKLLREAVDSMLPRVVTILLKDLTQPYPRDEKSMITVETGYPFARMRMQGYGFKLWEDDNTIVFIPKVGDVVVYSGVNILDKRWASSRAATADATPMLNFTVAHTQWPGYPPFGPEPTKTPTDTPTTTATAATSPSPAP